MVSKQQLPQGNAYADERAQPQQVSGSICAEVQQRYDR